MSLRFDTGSLRAVVTQDGFLSADAVLAKPGVYEYRNPDGSIRREYIPPEELFAQDSLDSLEADPVTDEHPSEMVSARNYRSLSMGSVSRARNDGGVLVAPVKVYDMALSGRILSGEQSQLSLGKRIQYDPIPGVTPDGQRYDGVQRNIRYNHLAVTRKARLGDDISFRFDSADYMYMTDRIDADADAGRKKNMKFKTLQVYDSKTIQVPEHLFPYFKKMVDRKDSESEILAFAEQVRTDAEEKESLSQRIEKLEKAQSQHSYPAGGQPVPQGPGSGQGAQPASTGGVTPGDGSDSGGDAARGDSVEPGASELKARLDALEAKNKKLEEELKNSGARMDSAMMERSRLERIAVSMIPDTRTDSMDNRGIKLAIIQKALPFDQGTRIDSLEDVVINARFDAAVEVARVAPYRQPVQVDAGDRVDSATVEKYKNEEFWGGTGE